MFRLDVGRLFMKKLMTIVLMMLAGVNLFSCVYGQETADLEQAGASGFWACAWDTRASASPSAER